MTSYPPEGAFLKTRDNQAALSSPERLKEAFEKGKQLEAKAAFCDKEHNLHIDFGFADGIIPRNECAVGIEEGTLRDIAIIARVNKPVRFLITDLYGSGQAMHAVLSRRAVQKEFLEYGLSGYQNGDVIDSVVTHLENFGAFCDIGCGINALLPIDNISVSRIPHPNVRFAAGDEIRTVIKEIAPDGRVTLSQKELLGTWEENAALFSVGETVSGIIRSVESYGVFVELTPNLAGLAEYTSLAEEGQQASVYIKSIIPEKMKFKLIIVDSFNESFTLKKPTYFFSGDHMDLFRYSPDCCDRIIETNFGL